MPALVEVKQVHRCQKPRWIGEVASGLLLGSLGSEKDAEECLHHCAEHRHIHGTRGEMSEIAWA